MNEINDKLLFKGSQRQTEISHSFNTWSYYLYQECVYTATLTADDETAGTQTNTHPCTHAEVHSACRHTVKTHTLTHTHNHTHITHTQTSSVTTYIFPLLSSLILEFITEKAHPCFLLFKPDVSSSSLPLFSFSLSQSAAFVYSIVVRGVDCLF